MGIATLLPHLKPYLPINPTILEAGAHIGRDTVKLARTFPGGHIYAFEPVPELFQQLQERTKNYSNVTCYPYALSDRIETQTMFVSSGRSTATSSLLEPEQELHPGTTFTQKTIVTTTIDSWAITNRIDRIDFMWLDMQGGELSALQAGQKILNSVSAIYTEISLEARYKSNPLYDELKSWLENHGFKEVYQQLIQPTWGNALLIRKDD